MFVFITVATSTTVSTQGNGSRLKDWSYLIVVFGGALYGCYKLYKVKYCNNDMKRYIEIHSAARNTLLCDCDMSHLLTTIKFDIVLSGVNTSYDCLSLN